MLAVRDLTIEYTSGGYKVRPINDLNLDVESGELVLLLGASGCGKTTLLSALATLLTPTAGTIHVGDVEVTGLRGPALVEYRRKTVGVVFQAFNLISSLNARENVEVPLRSAKVPRREARARAVELLDHVGLTDRMDHRPGDLSGGQQQRVAIARALAHDPPLVLADEPTAHLDYIQVDGVLRLLRELAQPGRVVVVATHDDRLLPLADRVVELSTRAVEDARSPAQVSLASGQVLFHEGDPGDLVYVVESGEVELVRDLAGGGEELVHVAAPDGYFGELAPMFGLRRSATARARTPAVVTGYTLRDFRTRQKT
jgi:putative ABC transport system ATP-binding protein